MHDDDDIVDWIQTLSFSGIRTLVAKHWPLTALYTVGHFRGPSRIWCFRYCWNDFHLQTLLSLAKLALLASDKSDDNDAQHALEGTIVLSIQENSMHKKTHLKGHSFA